MNDEMPSEQPNIFIQLVSVKWSNNYDREFSAVWKVLPRYAKKFVVFLAVFAFGISINGDWINVFLHVTRQLGYSSFHLDGMKDFWSYFIGSVVTSYGIFFGAGGFLHWFYYVRKRDRPEEWKCQPLKFMDPELEREEIIFGSGTLFLNATLSSILATHISNGGYSTIYYEFDGYGWTWFFLQFAVIFIYQDYLTYWMHRILHTPMLYKHFHKAHHKYKYPTAFSVTAIHPVESLFIQSVLVSPLFLFPVHWFAFYVVAIYTYIHGILQHSGINLKAYWWQPWQPDSMFHDNHHQYFHVNFGFNIEIWDKIHGTHRQKDRIYNEDIFYGIGKPIQEATKEEIATEVAERKSENPLAHRDNVFELNLENTEIGKALNDRNNNVKEE